MSVGARLAILRIALEAHFNTGSYTNTLGKLYYDKRVRIHNVFEESCWDEVCIAARP